MRNCYNKDHCFDLQSAFSSFTSFHFKLSRNKKYDEISVKVCGVWNRNVILPNLKKCLVLSLFRMIQQVFKIRKFPDYIFHIDTFY